MVPQRDQEPAQGLRALLTWFVALIRCAWPAWLLLLWLEFAWFMYGVATAVPFRSMLVAAAVYFVLVLTVALAAYSADQGLLTHTLVLRVLPVISLLLAGFGVLARCVTGRGIPVSWRDALLRVSWLETRWHQLLRVSAGIPSPVRHVGGALVFLLPAGLAASWGVLLAASGELTRLCQVDEPFEGDVFVQTVVRSFESLQSPRPYRLTASVDSLRRIKRGRYELTLSAVWRVVSDDGYAEPEASFREKVYLIRADREGRIVEFEEKAEKA